VNIKRNVRTGPLRPVRNLSVLMPAAGLVLAAAIPPAMASAAAPATAAPAAAAVPVQAATMLGQGLNDFYDARREAPLWFSHPGRQAATLIELLRTAQLDGLDPAKYQLSAIEKAVREAGSGKEKAVRRADMLLSQAFVDYVRDMKTPGNTGTVYVDEALRPKPPTARYILLTAAQAPSLEQYVASMAWMHPSYSQLRRALASGSFTPEQQDLLRVNLERARELPVSRSRYVLVNAAAQRLYMYEGGAVVDSMRVVVGKPKYPTPMMTAYIRFAALNPYWYVPADLTAERIAPNVVKLGLGYLDRQGYQVVSDFVDNPTIIDPKTIDWKAVADGKLNILVRQMPGPYNSMGRIKFMFPNNEGVYLHDNPERELFEQAARLYSGGCVRLEDAWRLSHWIFGRDLTWEGAAPEERVMLDKQIPVYITYLTAIPDGANIAFLDDVYKRDATRVAQLHDASGSLAAN
jgi:murein L,D-transpeptidase YcbB/YkuD